MKVKWEYSKFLGRMSNSYADGLLSPYSVCLIQSPILNVCDGLDWHTTKEVQQGSYYCTAQLPLQVHREITRDTTNLGKKCFNIHNFCFLKWPFRKFEIILDTRGKKIATKKYQFTFYPEILSSFAHCPSHVQGNDNMDKSTLLRFHMAPRCLVSPDSFNGRQFLNRSLTFMTLTSLKLLGISFSESFSM